MALVACACCGGHAVLPRPIEHGRARVRGAAITKPRIATISCETQGVARSAACAPGSCRHRPPACVRPAQASRAGRSPSRPGGRSNAVAAKPRCRRVRVAPGSMMRCTIDAACLAAQRSARRRVAAFPARVLAGRVCRTSPAGRAPRAALAGAAGPLGVCAGGGGLGKRPGVRRIGASVQGVRPGCAGRAPDHRGCGAPSVRRNSFSACAIAVRWARACGPVCAHSSTARRPASVQADRNA